jgi:hypothetical protein
MNPYKIFSIDQINNTIVYTNNKIKSLLEFSPETQEDKEWLDREISYWKEELNYLQIASQK